MAVTAGFNILEGCGQMLCLANILKNYRMAKSFLRFFVPDNNFIEKRAILTNAGNKEAGNVQST